MNLNEQPVGSRLPKGKYRVISKQEDAIWHFYEIGDIVEVGDFGKPSDCGYTSPATGIVDDDQSAIFHNPNHEVKFQWICLNDLEFVAQTSTNDKLIPKGL